VQAVIIDKSHEIGSKQKRLNHAICKADALHFVQSAGFNNRMYVMKECIGRCPAVSLSSQDACRFFAMSRSLSHIAIFGVKVEPFFFFAVHRLSLTIKTCQYIEEFGWHVICAIIWHG